ncbi:hypothetical protein ABZ070_24710 [Streptomyces sp. NPDC006283]|uniref:hypothetical protein n=1 Tax=Streptomyces sp. NPDC006283 TaxID=3156741 RepID=UPI0033ABA9F9
MRSTDLYRRYQTAARDLAGHDRGCERCTSSDRTGTARCEVGAQLYEAFARLQGAYLTHLQNRP